MRKSKKYSRNKAAEIGLEMRPARGAENAPEKKIARNPKNPATRAESEISPAPTENAAR